MVGNPEICRYLSDKTSVLKPYESSTLLLICEECYYEMDSNWRHPWVSEENCNLLSGVQAQDTVHLLVNKMMENHVNIVGEGLVGRVAFTVNHQWILSENYHGEANPPESGDYLWQAYQRIMVKKHHYRYV